MWLLARARFIQVFGRASDDPGRTSRVRLVGMALIAAGSGFFLSNQMKRMYLPTDLPTIWLIIAAILASQIITVLISYLIRTSVGADDVLEPHLAVWPISEPVRWIVANLPAFYLLFIILLAAVGPLTKIALAFHFSCLYLWPAILLGIISGLGIGSYRPHRLIGLCFLLVIALIGAELLLFNQMILRYQTQFDPSPASFWQLVLLIVISLYWLYLIVTDWTSRLGRSNVWDHLAPSMPTGLNSWIGIKLLRNQKIRRSSLIIFSLCVILALAWLKTGVNRSTDVEPIILGLSFLGALSATDIRGIYRLKNPPEIINLRGVGRLIVQSYLAGLMLATILTLPLTAAILTVSGSVQHFSQVVIQLSLGVAIATLASSIFVPSPADFSSQLMSAVTSTVSLMIIQQIETTNKLINQFSFLVWPLLLATLTLAVWTSERRRNNYYWKETNYV